MLNLVEILKNCNRGTKLYSPVFGVVSFDRINTDDDEYPIIVFTSKGKESFTLDGKLYYGCEDSECMLFPSKENRDWSTFEIPKKVYDFKPYDKVLVRDSDDERWLLNLFSCIVGNYYKYVCLTGSYRQCIPYEGNELLLNTIENPK